MKELTQCDIENLKAMDWEYRDNRFPFIATNYDDTTFHELSGFDLRPIRNVADASAKTVYSEIAYTRPGVQDEKNYCLYWFVSVDGSVVCDGTIAAYPYDVLKLYEKLDKGDTVEEYFNDNLGEVVQKIKDTYPDVYNAIKNEEGNNYNLEATLQNAIDNLGEYEVGSFISDNFSGVYDVIRDVILDNLDTDDVPDWLKEDIGKEWCESNPEDAWGIAFDCMDNSDIKEGIIEYLNANL